MDGWAARQLQLVWFIPDRTDYSAYELFRTIASAPPTATNSGVMQPFAIPPNSHLMPGPFENANGQIDGSALNLSLQQQRIDVFLAPVAGPGEAASAPLFHNVEEKIADLSRFVGLLSNRIAKTTRLGFTGNYVEAQVSGQKASEAILQCLSIPTEPFEDASEVSFSINKPKRLSNVMCNRVVRWQPEAYTNMTLTFGPDGNLVPFSSSPVFAAGLSIDVNTAPGPGTIMNEALQKEIFPVLLSEGARLWKANRLFALSESFDG